MRVAAGLRYWLIHSGDGFLLPLLGLTFFWQLGLPALWDVREGALTAVSWEMWQRADGVSFYYQDELVSNAPVLLHCLQAVCVRVFGEWHEWVVRLPNALSMSVWVMSGYYFAKPYLDRMQLVWVAVMAATALGSVWLARFVSADALVVLFVSLCLFDMWRYIEQSTRVRLFRIFFWLGWAVLANGLSVLWVPVLVAAWWNVSQGKHAVLVRQLLNPFGWVVLLAVVLPWSVLHFQAQGWRSVVAFLVGQPTQLFAGFDLPVVVPALLQFFLILPLGLLPFAGLILPLTGAGVSMTGLMLSMLRVFRRGHEAVSEQTVSRFLAMWLVVGLFVGLVTRAPVLQVLGVCLMPLVVLVAKYSQRVSANLVVAPALLFAVVGVALPELLVLLNETDSDLVVRIQQAFDWKYRVAAGLYVVALMVLWRWQMLSITYRLVGVALLQTVFVTSIVIPLVGFVQQSPVKQAALAAKQYPSNVAVVMGEDKLPSFSVYRQVVTPQRSPAVGEYLVTRGAHLPNTTDYQVVFKQSNILIVRRMR